MAAVRTALASMACALNLPRGRYPDPTAHGRMRLQPDPLELAALALEVRDALDLIAAEQVARARELDLRTWEQIGERFGVSMQAAHSRFRQRL